MTPVTKIVNTSKLNVRRGAGTRFPIVDGLVKGAPVQVELGNPIAADGYSWLPLDYIAAEFLSDPAPPPLGRLKVGAHVSMRNYPWDAFIALLAQMHAAGNPLPCILLLGGDEIPISRIKKASPSTIVIYRYYRDTEGGPDIDAPTFFGRYIDPFPERHLADYFQLNNEWDSFGPDVIAWHLAQMKWCEANSGNYKKRLAGPTWGTGNPGGDPMQVFLRSDVPYFMRYTRDHGHVFTLHEYFRNDGNWNLFRFEDHVFPYLPADLKANMPPVIFTEWGQDDLAKMSAGQLLSLFRGYQARLANMPYCKGVCVFAIGDTEVEWKGFNFAPNMSVLAQI